MFNQTLVPSRTSNSTYPIFKRIAIKLSFYSGRVVCEITRNDRGPETYRLHNRLTPASAWRIAKLADRLTTFEHWITRVNVDGWLIISPLEVIK